MSWVFLFWVLGGTLAAGVLALLGWTLVNLFRKIGAPPPKMDGRFPRDRVRLLRAAARSLGGDVTADPRRYRFPFAKSAPPEEPLAIALVPVDEETRDPSSPYIVRVEAPVLGARYLELWPVGSSLAPARVNVPPTELLLGDPGFDGRYILRTDDRDFTVTLLDADFREALNRAWGVGRGGRVRVEIDGYRVRLQKEEQLSSAADLVALAEAGRRLRVRVRAALEECAAVQFLDAPQATLKPSCPVCGAELKAGKVACRRCRTPHHRECWDYMGRCSMFACGEAQFSS